MHGRELTLMGKCAFFIMLSRGRALQLLCFVVKCVGKWVKIGLFVFKCENQLPDRNFGHKINTSLVNSTMACNAKLKKLGDDNNELETGTKD